MIPDAAVEAAESAAEEQGFDAHRSYVLCILEAAAPHMRESIERELADTNRVVALLVTEAGGKVSLSRRAITEMPDDTVLETTQDVVNGGWVIRARVREVAK